MKTRCLSIVLAIAMSALLAGCGGMSAPSGSGAASPQAQKALRAAYSQMGKPYVLGGCSPRQGFDCSGLIYWAYKQNGVNVPRRTTGQIRAGRQASNPLPGDIVVFRTGATSLHTGMYAGGNSFIHSPRTGQRVRMESLSTPYWKKRLVAVRRVAG